LINYKMWLNNNPSVPFNKMKTKRLVNKVLVLFIFTANTCVFAEQKYNPFSRQWETVSPGAELNYNPYSREYEYAPEDSWETTTPDAEPQYNPHERIWEYPR